MEIKIRDVLAKDLDEVKKIAKYEFDDFFDGDYEKMMTDNNYKFVVALIDDKVCGFLILLMVDEKAEVIKVATGTSFRRMGVAKTLMEFGIAYARERLKTGVILEVNEKNEPAKQLYQKLGFVPIHIRKNYYNKYYEKEYSNITYYSCIMSILPSTTLC